MMSNRPEQLAAIPIAWVNRDDLIHCHPELKEQIMGLDEGDIAHIAEKIGDALQACYPLAVSVGVTEFFAALDTDADNV